MADRNEVFRIILEGRDKLSGQLDSVRKSADALDKSLQKLKRNKPDEFPLFGGGKAVRGPGGQFVTAQDLSNLDKAKVKLNEIDAALVRVKNRAKRGPLIEGEQLGAGNTRIARGEGGRFVKAADLTLLQRMNREFSIVSRNIRDIQTQTKQGFILETENLFGAMGKGVRHLDAELGKFLRKFRRGTFPTFGGGQATRGPGGQFVKVEDISLLNKAKDGVDAITAAIQRLRNSRIKEGEFVLFGGGRAVRGPGGQFIKKEEISFVDRLRQRYELLIGTIKRTKIEESGVGSGGSGKGPREGLLDSFREGFKINLETARLLDENIVKTKEAYKLRKLQLDDEEKAEKVRITATQQAERAVLRQQQNERNIALRERIQELKEEARELSNSEEDRHEKFLIRQEQARLRFETAEINRKEQEAFTARFADERAALGVDFRNQRAQLARPDIEKVEAEVRAMREEALKADTVLGRLGKRAGLALGDVIRGFRNARKGADDLEGRMNLVSNSFTRLGLAVGTVFRNFGSLVNLRWVFITGVLSTLLTLLVQVGAALAAIGASAAQAGAALGGALAAGAAQAAPVVGILAAAMGRFGAVLDLVKQREKLDAKAIIPDADQAVDAAQRLEDAQWSLKKAIEAVADAQYDLNQANKDVVDAMRSQKQAANDLAEARRQAAKDIIDANFEERDAALALREADLAVLDAKKRLREEEERRRGSQVDVEGARAALREAQERLRIAKEQQDQSEISGAQQAVSIAEQNLNSILDRAAEAQDDIKELQLGIERANLNREQAATRATRSRQEAAQSRSKGIEGADVVKAAQERLANATESVANAQRQVVLSNRNVRDALRAVAVANREVGDAERDKTSARKKATQADEDAKKAFADLSPAEKNLYRALERIRATFKRVFSGTSERDGILGPITNSLARFVNILEKMLRDPRIQRAARTLANSLGRAFDKLADFVGSNEARNFLIGFIDSAAANIPKIVTATLNLFRTFLRIAEAATPLFNRLLDRFTGATRGAEKITRGGPTRRPDEGGGIATIRQSPLTNFFDKAEKHLNTVIDLGKAMTNLFAAFIGGGAAKAGNDLLGSFVDKLNEWAEWLRENDVSVVSFFENNREAIQTFAESFGKVIPALIKAFSSPEFINFGKFLIEVIIPGLVLMIRVVGKVLGVLLELFEIPIVGDLIKWALTFAVAEKALTKLFPVTQKLTTLLNRGLLTAVKAVGRSISNFTITPLIRAFDRVGKAAFAAQEAIKRFIIQVGLAAKAAAGAVLGAMKRLAVMIGTVLVNAFRILRLNIRLLLLTTGIGALIVAAVLLIEHWDKVKEATTKLAKWLLDKLRGVADWVKNNWKKMALILLAPFAVGGLLLLGLMRFKTRIFEIFGNIKNAIIGAFRRAFNWVRTELGNLASWIGQKVKSIPVFGRFFGNDSPGDIAKSMPEKLATQIVPKLPRNKQTLIREKREAGLSDKQILEYLLESGLVSKGQLQRAVRAATGKAGGWSGSVTGAIAGGGTGAVTDTVPAMLTPGEWVLNRSQQARLAAKLKMSVQQTRAYIFGTNMGNTKPGVNATNNQRGKKIEYYRDFNLVPQEDEDGNMVWFIQLANGSFGQVTGRDAKKIQNTNGEWIPNYVKRSAAGFKQATERIITGGISGYALGGVVGSPAVQRFARGGIVQTPGYNGKTNSRKTINQNFSVETHNETDWGYVMRLGAVAAQEAY